MDQAATGFERLFTKGLELREIRTGTKGYLGPAMAKLYGLPMALQSRSEFHGGRFRSGRQTRSTFAQNASFYAGESVFLSGRSVKGRSAPNGSTWRAFRVWRANPESDYAATMRQLQWVGVWGLLVWSSAGLVAACNTPEPSASETAQGASLDPVVERARAEASAAASEAKAAAAEAKAVLEAAKAAAQPSSSETSMQATAEQPETNDAPGASHPAAAAVKPSASAATGTLAANPASAAAGVHAVVANSSKPPATTAKPPATTAKPPATTAKPPATTAKPPATTSAAPTATAKPPKTKPGLFSAELLNSKSAADGERKRKTQAPTRPGAK